MADQKSIEPTNEVYLRGRVSHMFGSDRYGSMTVPYNKIISKRTRADGQLKFEQSVETYLPEAVFNSNTKTKGIIRDYREGDRVLIKGYLGSYSYQAGAGYEERTVVYIDEIAHDSTRLEEMLQVPGLGGKYSDPMHEVSLEAKVIGMTKRHDTIYEFRLECVKDGRTYAITGTYFRAPQGLEKRIHLNDTVYVLGSIETARTEYRGKAYFSQTFVIEELVTQAEVMAKFNESESMQASYEQQAEDAEIKNDSAATGENSITEENAEAYTTDPGPTPANIDEPSFIGQEEV